MSQFPNLNSLKLWAKTNDIKFMGEFMPYVQKEELFYYFGLNGLGKGFVLLMTSLKDLGVQA